MRNQPTQINGNYSEGDYNRMRRNVLAAIKMSFCIQFQRLRVVNLTAKCA